MRRRLRSRRQRRRRVRPHLLGRLDGDGVVATQDVLLILSEFGCTPGCTTDVNLDGFVAIDDFLFLLGEFGNTCGERLRIPSAQPNQIHRHVMAIPQDSNPNRL